MHPEVEMSDPSEDADSLNKISAPSESDRAAEDKLPESDTNDPELGGLGPTPAIAGKEAVGANVEGDSRREDEFDLVEVAKSSDAVEKSRELDGSKEAGGADVAEASGREDDGSSGSGEANRVEEEEEETKPLEKSPEHGGSSSPPATAGEEGDRADVAEVSGKEVSLEVSRREGEGMEVEKSNGSCQAVTVAVRSAVRPVSGEKKYAIQRSSCFHGVTKLKWSGKFEAHLWDNTSRMEGRKRKGKHVYLGTYDSEEEAARAHDLAALKYWGPTPNAKLNFPVSSFEKELETMKTMTQEEYVAHVRRQNSSFSRGSSSYRGVTRRRKGGKWQARIGRVGDKTDAKDIYLGTFDTEEEAAEAYDLAAIQLRGAHAVTNFDISNYYDEGLIPIEGACKQLAM